MEYSCKVEDYTSITAGRKATGRQNIKLFVLEVIGKFCVPAMEDQFFADLRGLADQNFLPLKTCPNELKLHIAVHKRLYYENIMSFILNVFLFGSSRAAKLGKNTARSAISKQCFSSLTGYQENVIFHSLSSIKMCSK